MLVAVYHLNMTRKFVFLGSTPVKPTREFAPSPFPEGSGAAWPGALSLLARCSVFSLALLSGCKPSRRRESRSLTHLLHTGRFINVLTALTVLSLNMIYLTMLNIPGA